MSRVRPESLPQEEENDDGDGSDDAEEDRTPPAKKSKSARKPTKQRVWNKKTDITHDPLPSFQHPTPLCVRSPTEYFQDTFTMGPLEDIVYQTNLYARQRNVNTNFSTDKHELMVFIGIVIFMGVGHYPAIDDYWATYTRVPQVADVMSSKRFKLIRSMLHFNNNENLAGSTDRFFKIRPMFSSIVRQFQLVKATPTQSVDEVMVAYKGTRAGNLRQYIQNKPDKWGYKLFCRASIDGFIHDILIYQGETTFSSHHLQLNEEETNFLVSTKTVVVLAKSLKNPSQSAIYADNYFTSIELVEYLRDNMGCRYVGTARENRIGHPPLMPSKEMDKKTVPRGKYDYASTNGILALRWKDNKNVTLLSSDAGIEPIKKVQRFDKKAKKKVDVPCPDVIKQYNGKMGGIDKSDMLVHLHKTPMRARRWYMKMFGYVLDLCVCNAWILYKRDCNALKEKPMPLKQFRLDISRFARCHKAMTSRIAVTRSLSPEVPLIVPRKGQRLEPPSDQCRYDPSKMHLPVSVTIRQTCKRCSHKDDMHRSRWMCSACQVALCLSEKRNCFKPYHIPPQPTPSPSPSTSAASTP